VLRTADATGELFQEASAFGKAVPQACKRGMPYRVAVPNSSNAVVLYSKLDHTTAEQQLQGGLTVLQKT